MSAQTVEARPTVCTWAACKLPATTRSGEWDFCAFHAEQDRAMQEGDEPEGEDLPEDFLAPEANGHGTEARARKHYRDGEQPCAPCLAAAARAHEDQVTRRSRPMTTPTQPSLLERASASHSAKVRRLGTKIEGLLDDLRNALNEAQVEDAARAEIEALEAKLAEAKARLRGKPTPVRASTAGRSITRNLDPLECRKGCGKVSQGAQGRAGHERHCEYAGTPVAASA